MSFPEGFRLLPASLPASRFRLIVPLNVENRPRLIVRPRELPSGVPTVTSPVTR
jgi:hypothetical protein